MQVTEFNANTTGKLAKIVSSGEPELITWHRSRKPYARVMSDALYEDLLKAAGKRGQDVLARHAEAAEQQEETAA